MSNFCLIPKQVEEMKKAFKDKEISGRDLLLLDHDALVEKLRPYAGNAAEQVATLFEEKRILKNKLQGVKNAVSKLTETGKYSPDEKARLQQVASDYRAAQQEKIFNPKQGEGYLGGIVEDITGLKLPREAAKKIFAMNAELTKLKEVGKNDVLGVKKEFLLKQKEMNNFLNTFDQKSALVSIRDSMATIYKNLFIGVKTGVKTMTMGMVNSGIEAVNRRITNVQALGSVNSAVKRNFVVQNIKMGIKTGVNTILKNSLESGDEIFGKSDRGLSEFFGGKDTIAPGNKILTNTAKLINLASRGLKWLTIDVLHKAPMLLNSSLNFADALDLTSSRLAKSNFAKTSGMNATAIFQDASKVEPQTDLGKIARARSQEDSFRVLNINNTPLSEVTMKLQRAINDKVPTFGSYLIPMAKVPSNVIYNGLENFGVGLGTGTYNIMKGVGELNTLKKAGKEDTAEGAQAADNIRAGASTLVRTIGLMGAAALITMNLGKNDFKTDNYGNSYVRMGDYWLSTNIFGSAGVAVAGMMMGKTGNNGFIFDYGKESFDSLENAPVADSINSVIQNGKSGKLFSGFINSFINPILAQDVEKSIKQKSVLPLLTGTMIRTDQEMRAEERANAQKAAQTRRNNANNKNKSQSFF